MGAISSIKNADNDYVAVIVSTPFYNLTYEDKKAIINAIHIYYQTLANKSDDSSFMVMLFDLYSGKEIGTYYQGSLELK